jgi:hypothetical protein
LWLEFNESREILGTA